MKRRALHKYPNRTYRIRPEAAELIRAWATQRQLTQAQFLEYLLTKISPPTATGHLESQVRTAHTNLLAAMSRTGDL